MSIGSKLGGIVFRAGKATIGFVAADIAAPVAENVADFGMNVVGIKVTTKELISKVSEFVGAKIDGLKLAKGERAILVIDGEIFVMPKLTAAFSKESIKAKLDEIGNDLKGKADARFNDVGSIKVAKVTEAQAQAINVAKKAKADNEEFDLDAALTSILGPDFINAGTSEEVAAEPSCDEINESQHPIQM